GDEVEQVVDEVRGAERLLLHFLQQPVFRIVGRRLGEEELRVRGDAGERRVDLVRDAGREEAERSQALLVLQLALEAHALGDVADDDDDSMMFSLYSLSERISSSCRRRRP